jgi:AraC family chitin signaling transcriptional activator
VLPVGSIFFIQLIIFGNKNGKVRIKTCQFILFFFISIHLHAQELLPFVENFTKSEYNGDNQVWNVVQGNDHAMYFANNHYFLRYNGIKWERYALPNKTIIRSIFCDGDRIYCGSYNEFGYWKRISGIMKYFSLSEGKRLFEGISDNEEIWKMFKYQGKIYFQSFNELFIYDNNTIQKIRFPSQISYCYLIDGEIYVASVKNGVWLMKGNKFVRKDYWEKLQDNVVHHIEKHNGRIYIFTKNNGIFIEEGGSLSAWNNPLNSALKDQVIITAKFIDKNTLAIGTGLQGLYIVTLSNGTWKNINRQNALKNNAILSIATDKENDLWLGNDNGICHIEINSPVSVFLDNSGVLGSVYSLSPIGNNYLFATNHGIFTSKNGNLEVIPDSQGQVWDIYHSGGQFIIGHNDGTFTYDGRSLKNVNPVNGGWKFLDSPFDRVLFQANYSGIAVYPDKNNLSDWKTLQGLTKPIRNIGQEIPRELWAADNYRSLYRIRYDANFITTSIENVSLKNGISNDYGVKIFSYNGKLLFLIDNNWYVYDRAAGKLTKDGGFNNVFKDISDIIPVDDKSFMVVKGGLLYLILETRDKFVWKLIPEKYYQGKLIIENTKVYKNGNLLLVNLDDGFMSFALNKSNLKVPKVNIEAFYQQHLIPENVDVKYNESIEIHAVPEYYGFSRPDFFYNLNGKGNFVRMKMGHITLSNLESGKQHLDVYFHDGRKFVKIAAYKFNVGNPWYFSFWMILFYLVVIALVCYLYYKWNSIRYNQKLELREEELKHQKDIMEIKLNAENELRIQEYEKHILELEIQSKSSEVAGKSFSIAKQGEVMDNIKKILDNESDIKTARSEIKRAIKTNTINKHEWEAFETNMKQIHNVFISRLIDKYPNLSSKDIRLSIYLKMNLSSKEIAPLMNISFRGVELHRYRLRKKMGLPQEINLNKFMLEV